MAKAKVAPLLRNTPRNDQSDPFDDSRHARLTHQRTYTPIRKNKHGQKDNGHVEGYLYFRFKSKPPASLWLFFLLLLTATNIESSSSHRNGAPVTPAPAQKAPTSAPSEPNPGLRAKRCTNCSRPKSSPSSTKPRNKPSGRGERSPAAVSSQREVRVRAQIRIHAEGSACTGRCL